MPYALSSLVILSGSQRYLWADQSKSWLFSLRQTALFSVKPCVVQAVSFQTWQLQSIPQSQLLGDDQKYFVYINTELNDLWTGRFFLLRKNIKKGYGFECVFFRAH